jgi:hypothetical protein
MGGVPRAGAGKTIVSAPPNRYESRVQQGKLGKMRFLTSIHVQALSDMIGR